MTRLTTSEEASALALLSGRRQELTDRLSSIENGSRRLGLEAPDPDDDPRQLNDKEVLDRFSELTWEELAQVLRGLGRLQLRPAGRLRFPMRPQLPAGRPS